MFSQTAEYALRAMVCLAQHPGEAMTTAAIAQRTRVPPSYLSKVLQGLIRAGLIHATRGLGGGHTLARPAAATSILEVVNAVDPIRRIRSCPLGIASHGPDLCAMHRQLDDAIAHIESTLGSATLSRILDQPTASIPLRPTPPGG